MNAYHSRGKEDDKRKKLLERREKLRTLIREEKEKLEVSVSCLVEFVIVKSN